MATKGKATTGNGKGNAAVSVNLGTILGFEIPTRVIQTAVLLAAWMAETTSDAWASLWGDKCPEAPGKTKRAMQRAMAAITLRGQNPDERVVDGALRLPLDPMRDGEGVLLRDPVTGRVKGHVVTVVELNAEGKRERGIAETALAWGIYRGERKANKSLPLMNVCAYTVNGVECETDYLKAEITGAYEEFAANPTDADLRPVIVEMVQACVPLYVKGRTVQFVGKEHNDAIGAVQRILKACGAYAFVGEFADTQMGRDSLIEAFMRSMDEEFNAAQQEIDGDAGADRDVREKTYKRHAKGLDGLMATAEYYSTLLGCAIDHIRERDAALRQTVIGKLTEVQTAKATAKPATGKAKGKTPTRDCPHCKTHLTGAALVSAKFCAACGQPLPPLVSVTDDSATPADATVQTETQTPTADASDPLATA